MDIRNSENHLLCQADEMTGYVEILGAHKSRYYFKMSTGGTITITRDGKVSVVARTVDSFSIKNI